MEYGELLIRQIVQKENLILHYGFWGAFFFCLKPLTPYPQSTAISFCQITNTSHPSKAYLTAVIHYGYIRPNILMLAG